MGRGGEALGRRGVVVGVVVGGGSCDSEPKLPAACLKCREFG